MFETMLEERQEPQTTQTTELSCHVRDRQSRVD